MKNKFDKLISELENTIQVKELEFTEVFVDSPVIISILESGFDKMKSLMSDYGFEDDTEEIVFFKIRKPKLFSKLIYYQKIYHIELKRPISGYQIERAYLENELEQISNFCNNNADFIQYYRSGKTVMDEYYFLRGKRDLGLNLESFYFERDPKFSTLFDFKVSKLLANDMLAAYINCELARLKEQENNPEPPVSIYSKDEWTDKKVALAEIIYAIHEVRSVNNGNIHLKVLAAKFGRMFNIDMSDLYNMFLEIRSRKTDRTEYLNRLIEALKKRMDDADSK
jgi:hypothetical protein